jgi:hypothetical protein
MLVPEKTQIFAAELRGGEPGTAGDSGGQRGTGVWPRMVNLLI